MPKIDRMEYRCFHCKQVFTDDALARQHFGEHTTDLPLCLEYVQKGMGGGVHDAYIRVRKDEYNRLVGRIPVCSTTVKSEERTNE